MLRDDRIRLDWQMMTAGSNRGQAQLRGVGVSGQKRDLAALLKSTDGDTKLSNVLIQSQAMT